MSIETLDRNQRGIIYLATGFVDTMPHIVAEAFSRIRFLPTRVEHRYDMDKFAYYGLCPEFELLSPAEIPPVYELELVTTRDEKGKAINLEEVNLKKQTTGSVTEW